MNRKDDHIKHALKQEFKENDFDKIRFVHSALTNISFSDINLKTKLCGFEIDYPIYINAMTGGSEKAYEINDKLSQLAKHFNIVIASGSLSTALKDKSTLDSFNIIRKNYPLGIVMANIGADKSYTDAIKVIDILKADILQVHLNVVQEMIMPEGDRDFKNIKNNLKEIVNNVNIPVIVKEVGFGMSYDTLKELKSLDVKTIDISGKGGTNFAVIENSRREKIISSLNNYGLSTVESLLEANKITGLEILASGGVRNAMDIVKSLALGAKAVGMSSYFLKLVTEDSINEAIKKFETLLLEVKTIMTILGKRNIEELKETELIFSSDLESFMRQRGISLALLERRII